MNRFVAPLLLALLATACGGEDTAVKPEAGEEAEFQLPEGRGGIQADVPPLGAAITELQVVDTEVGSGEIAERGQLLSVNYQGWLYNPDTIDHKGFMFDRSKTRGRAFEFQLGTGRVIRGWDRGLLGMRTGGKRTLFIPADLAYGNRGVPGRIPPNATLMFEIELLEVRDPLARQ